MAIFTISLNQLVEASVSTSNAKTRIVKQQLVVNRILIMWYRLAKKKLKEYFIDVRNIKVLNDALAEIKKLPEEKKNAARDKQVSLEAIQKVINMKFDKILIYGYEILKIKDTSLELDDIRVTINPDLIFRYIEDGVVKIGALKYHVSKTKPFDLQQSRLIANLIKQLLEEKVANKDEVVDEKLCWSYDVFAERLLHADKDANISNSEIKNLCIELKTIFKSLNNSL
ncbi:hypothetical protein IM793_17400 [Pedobacter sp. MR2016-19]|uniref:hypothetical protein n=1 Tax=Pedobacter sp. MR2016-19 TaxID=2780089 RepID=UPI001874E4FA|nr:hypothetical protein [Pedobacter sp. MR2016-19]MBE5320945.1 hypothetical protein [Pedobacter sp. MR2016-19]